MKKYLSIVVLIALYSFTLLTEPWEKVIPAPKELQDLGDKETIDLQKAVKSWIAGGMKEDYSHWGEDSQEQVLVAYGLFNLGNYISREITASGNRDLQRCYDDKDDKDAGYAECSDVWLQTFKQKVAYPVYSSKSLQKIAYNWVKPYWKEAISKMDASRRNSYRSMLNHAIRYCENFDYQSEKEFLARCEKPDSELYFTSNYPLNADGEYDYDATPNNYRKIEAWVFRRVDAQHLSIDEIQGWLQKVKSELF
jgi:hypothetical protein